MENNKNLLIPVTFLTPNWCDFFLVAHLSLLAIKISKSVENPALWISHGCLWEIALFIRFWILFNLLIWSRLNRFMWSLPILEILYFDSILRNSLFQFSAVKDFINQHLPVKRWGCTGAFVFSSHSWYIVSIVCVWFFSFSRSKTRLSLTK